MSARRWAALFLALAAVLAGLSVWLLRPAEAGTAQVWLDGQQIAVLPLTEDTELLIELPGGGYNRIVVSSGCVAVAEADCPDGICVARGPVQGGAPVVCLPHRLVITFSGDALDSVAG